MNKAVTHNLDTQFAFFYEIPFYLKKYDAVFEFAYI